MKCLGCINATKHKGGEAMARQGFVGCSLRPIYEYFAVDRERECADFKPATAETVAKRTKWVTKK